MKINEILQESNILRLSQDIFDKIHQLYKDVMENLPEVEQKTPYSKAIIPPIFKNYFKIRPLKGKPITISIAFYNDDDGAAALSTVMNLSGLQVILKYWHESLSKHTSRETPSK